MNRLALLSMLVLVAVAGPLSAEERVYEKDGLIRIRPLPVDEKFINPWPADWEKAFAERSDRVIKALGKPGGYGNKYFENEKASYPNAMMGFLAGHREPALGYLQSEDVAAESWNTHTKGIDLFPSFTIKGQMRKYYFFGQYLEPEYRSRMKEAAKIWTERDPMRRPHHSFKGGGDGWTPEVKNSWVDVRNTDNLRAMRETSVYLMAEETGNEEVRQLYKHQIRRYVWALYHIGMGEWDSENYHFHTITAYLNLYDFAKDPEVRAIAKAGLDWLSAAGAVKYFKGGFAGPIKRDYNKPYVFGGAAGELWLWFDDAAIAPSSFHGDLVYPITSAYRPPAAVVALARKQFDLPVEILASKPTYETWKVEGSGASAGAEYPAPNYWSADHKPEFQETTFIANTYQFGTLTGGSGGDVNGFKLLVANSKRSVDFYYPGTGNDAMKATTPIGNVAQYRNLAIVLRNGGGDYFWYAPASLKLETQDGVTFKRFENTYVAFWPINIAAPTENAEMKGKLKNRPDDTVLTSKVTQQGISGFAIEIGEPQTHGDYNTFKRDVLAKAKLNREQLAQGKVTLTGSNGDSVGIEIGNGGPKIFRNGQPHTREDHMALWASPGGKGPISLGWKEGTLRVEAGGHTFTATVPNEGDITFGK
jgi:hypothetical protein